MGGAYSMHGSDKKLNQIVRKLEWKRLPIRPRYSWESNVKINFIEIGSDDVCWRRTEMGGRLLWTKTRILFLWDLK